MYAGLQNSYQWNQLNANGGLTAKIRDILSEGQRIYASDIPGTMFALKNRVKPLLTTKLIEALESGQIQLYYAPTVKIPVYLPFILTNTAPNTTVGIVFLNNLSPSKNEGEELIIDPKLFAVSLESCYIAWGLNELGNSSKLRSNAILRSGSMIYSSILVECIDRKHSVKLDQSMHKALMYLSSKYYIGTMLGFMKSMDEETMQSYCLYNCKGGNYTEIKKYVEGFTNDDFKDIGTFLSAIKNHPMYKKRLANLTVSNFLETYINMYNASMLLGLEVFGYFLYNIMSVNSATYVNNYPLLKNMVGSEGKQLYADLVVTVSNL